MGKLEAALRDPIFYRWHAFIDDVIQRYRNKLKPYPLADVSEKKFDYYGMHAFFTELESKIYNGGKNTSGMKYIFES